MKNYIVMTVLEPKKIFFSVVDHQCSAETLKYENYLKIFFLIFIDLNEKLYTPGSLRDKKNFFFVVDYQCSAETLKYENNLKIFFLIFIDLNENLYTPDSFRDKNNFFFCGRPLVLG